MISFCKIFTIFVGHFNKKGNLNENYTYPNAFTVFSACQLR